MKAAKHEAKIARWKAVPLPYCITNLSKPIGKRRFATTDEALAAASAYDARYPGGLTFIDFAGAYDRAAA